MRQEDGRTDPLIPASGRIGPIDTRQDGDTQFFELRVTVEAGPLAATVGIHLLLLRQLDTGTVHQPDEGQVHNLCDIGGPQVVLGLPGYPGTGHPLIIEPDQHAPPPVDPGKAVDHTRTPGLLMAGIEDGMEGTERPGVSQVLDPLPDGHLTALVDLLDRDSHFLDPLDLLIDPAHDFLR